MSPSKGDFRWWALLHEYFSLKRTKFITEQLNILQGCVIAKIGRFPNSWHSFIYGYGQVVLAKSILKLWIDVYLTLNVAFKFWKIERIILMYNNQSNLWIGNLEFSFHFLLWLFDQEISTIEYPEQQPKSFYNTLTVSCIGKGLKHCQRHNGPEGWVHLSKVTYWVISQVQTQILIKLHLQNLDQDSTS